MRDDGSLHHSGLAEGDKMLNSGCVLMVQVTAFTNRLDIHCEKKRAVNAYCQISHVNNLKNVITIY